VDDTGSLTATTSMLAMVATPTDAVGVTFEAASMGGSRLSVSILEGMTMDTAMVMAVIATAAMPKATRGIEVS
jgi:chemotaxis response regulator CheB